MTEETEGLEVMDVDQAAEYLHLSRRTIYKMAMSGDMPGTKIAGAWRFPKAALDSWLNEKARENLGGKRD